ncbi:hypothetical protein [Parasitella parasitica]|uniref:Uncharacterized protein n=1 Tax=Parasitella parasitica TaxID=35722 RepID=A0A0B7N1L3_9FUNG|nr:hypothetical protein [Parasitella parasitica]
MGLQNSRILDTHYPNHHSVALLVHNEYVDTVLGAFAKADVSPITDFDPLSPSALNDPKYTGSSDTDFLLSEAKRLHQDRLVKVVLRIHDQNRQIAVARDFYYGQHLISQDQFAELYASIKPSSRAQGRTRSAASPDALMTDAAASSLPSNTIISDTSSPAISPADGLSAPSA